MRIATLILPNGNKIEVYSKGEAWTLEELQEKIGGYIQTVPSTEPGKVLVVDEDGKNKGLAQNPEADKFYANAGSDYIVGRALLLPEEDL